MKKINVLKKDFPFKGRELELSIINDSISSTLNYNGKCIFIEGDAGYGKTRLVKEIKKAVDINIFHILSVKAFQDMTYMSPIDKMLYNYLSNTDNIEKKITQYIKIDDLKVIININNNINDFYPYEIKKSTNFSENALFNSLFKLFKKLSLFYPLIIIIDDLHLVSEEVLRFINFLTERIDELPILIILTSRKDINILNFRNIEKLKLMPIKGEDINKILTELLNSNCPKRFVKWLTEISQGIPYYIEEILIYFIKINLIIIKDNIVEIQDYFEDIQIPENIFDFILRKLNLLNNEKKKVLETASVYGEVFNFDEIISILKKYTKDKIKNILNSLISENLLDLISENKYKFHHSLESEVLSKNMKIEVKRKIHRKITDILKKSNPDNTEKIIYHQTQYLEEKEFNLNLLNNLYKVIQICFEKRNWRVAKKYINIAQRIINSSINISEKEKLKLEIIYIKYNGYIDKKLPERDKIKTIVDKCINYNFKREALSIYDLLTNYLIRNYDFANAEKNISEMIKIAKELRIQIVYRIKYLKCILYYEQGKYSKSENEAVKLYNEIDPNILPTGKWHPANFVGNIKLTTGDLIKAKEYYEIALEIAKNVNNKDIIATTYGNLSIVYREMGDLDKSETYVEKDLKIVLEINNLKKIASAYNYLSSCTLIRRDYKLAFIYSKKSRKINKKNPLFKRTIEYQLKLIQIYNKKEDYYNVDIEIKIN